MEIDLETLKYVQKMFRIHSDMSTKCNGYRSLCDLIEKMETGKILSDFNIPDKCINSENINKGYLNKCYNSNCCIYCKTPSLSNLIENKQ